VQLVKDALDRGECVFLVSPQIGNSDEAIEDCEELVKESVQQRWKWWAAHLGEERMVMVHGKVAAKERTARLERARSEGGIAVVATTVIEVGINIPHATVMVVEGAHRFGLAQLHQLRGRVGRSELPGTCVLVAPGGDTVERLAVLARESSGFAVAEADLTFRGPGSVKGYEQAGLPDFHFANLSDVDELQFVRSVAEKYRADERLQFAGDGVLESGFVD
jgi:ATP-dependent DNA helicase RecG